MHTKWQSENCTSIKNFIFGENRDIETVFREPFSNDLAHILNGWTVPLRKKNPQVTSQLKTSYKRFKYVVHRGV